MSFFVPPFSLLPLPSLPPCPPFPLIRAAGAAAADDDDDDDDAAAAAAAAFIEGEQLILRKRQARADRFKADFFSILRAHQSAVAGLLEEAMARGEEAADPVRLSEARNAALEKLTENFARRQEVAT